MQIKYDTYLSLQAAKVQKSCMMNVDSNLKLQQNLVFGLISNTYSSRSLSDLQTHKLREMNDIWLEFQT